MITRCRPNRAAYSQPAGVEGPMVEWAEAPPIAPATTITTTEEGDAAAVDTESIGLPEGWSQVWDAAAGSYYYLHEPTGTIQSQAPLVMTHWEYSLAGSSQQEYPISPDNGQTNSVAKQWSSVEPQQSQVTMEGLSSIDDVVYKEVVVAAAPPAPDGGELEVSPAVEPGNGEEKETPAPPSSITPLGDGDPPGTMAVGWEMSYDADSGQPFYVNRVTNETRWDLPSAAGPAVEAPSISTPEATMPPLAEASGDTTAILRQGDDADGDGAAPSAAPPSPPPWPQGEVEGNDNEPRVAAIDGGEVTSGGQPIDENVAADTSAATAMEPPATGTPGSRKNGNHRCNKRNKVRGGGAPSWVEQEVTALVFTAPATTFLDIEEVEGGRDGGDPAAPQQQQGEEWVAGNPPAEVPFVYDQPQPLQEQQQELPSSSSPAYIGGGQLVQVERRMSDTLGTADLLLKALGWVELFDPSSGFAYYYNESTGETSWTNPVHGQVELMTATERRRVMTPTTGDGGNGDAMQQQQQQADVQEQQAVGVGGLEDDSAAIMAWTPPSQQLQQQQQQLQQQQQRVQWGDGGGVDGERGGGGGGASSWGYNGGGGSPERVMRETSSAVGWMEGGGYATLPMALDWQEHVDDTTGQVYYYSPSTTESRWDRPPELRIADDDEQAQQQTQQQQTQEVWQEMYDPMTGQLYFYNEQTQESRWALAPGVDLEEQQQQQQPGSGGAGSGYDAMMMTSPYQQMANPYDAMGGTMVSMMMVDYSQLETLQYQAGAEVEELQRAVEAQNSLVHALERTVHEITHSTTSGGGRSPMHQQQQQQEQEEQQAHLLAAQSDMLKNLESAVVNIQAITRGFLSRRRSSSIKDMSAQAGGITTKLLSSSSAASFSKKRQEQELMITATARKAQHKNSELDDLLDFAYDDEDQARKTRAAAVMGRDEEDDEEEQEEERGADGKRRKKRSDAVVKIVPARLVQAWRYRRSRKAEDIANAARAVNRFSAKNLARAKGRFREMLTELKEKDRVMDLKFAEPDSDTESDYEEVDLEDIFPQSIVLGQRGKYMELLEPKRAFIYYRNVFTGKFQKEAPNFDDEEDEEVAARKGKANHKDTKQQQQPQQQQAKRATAPAPSPLKWVGQKQDGKKGGDGSSSSKDFTERHWAERLRVLRRRRARGGGKKAGTSNSSSSRGSVFSLPAMQLLQDQALQKLYTTTSSSSTNSRRRSSGGDSSAASSQPAAAASGSASAPGSARQQQPQRPVGLGPPPLGHAVDRSPSSIHKRPSVGTALGEGLAASMPYMIPPTKNRRQLQQSTSPTPPRPASSPGVRKARPIGKEQQSPGKEGDEVKAEDEEESEEEEDDEEQQHKPVEKERFVAGGPVRPLFGSIGSAKEHLNRAREQAQRRSAQGEKQRDFRSRVAARRTQASSQQSQTRFLTDMCQELLFLLNRYHSRRPAQSVKRRHYVELLRFQSSCLGMAQHHHHGQEDEEEEDRGEGKGKEAAGGEGGKLGGFEFKGLSMVRDDGFWLELVREGEGGGENTRLWVRDRQGWPAAQPGMPLRYRLLSLVHANSLKQRLPGGWREHRWREGRGGSAAVGENRAYFNQVNHEVSWRKPAAIALAPLINTSSNATGQQQQPLQQQAGGAGSSNKKKPRPPPPPSTGLLKPLTQSHLTGAIVTLLREPHPDNQRSIIAVTGFALLLVQGELFTQALPALCRAVALALAEEEQQKQQHKAATDGTSATGPAAATGGGASTTTTAKQRAQLCLAVSCLCLITNDFREADKAARLAVATARTDPDVLVGAGDVLAHLGRQEEAEELFLASLLCDPTHQATYRSYARLCATRGDFDFATHYYERATASTSTTTTTTTGGSGKASSSWSSYHEAAEACLEYACYLMEPWELRIVEAERYMRRAWTTLTTRGQQTGFGLSFNPPLPPRADNDVDTYIMADVCFAMGRLYHLHRRESPKAATYYTHATKLNPMHQAALFHHACLLATSRLSEDHRNADALFRRSFTISPGGATAQQRPDLLPSLLYSQFLASSSMADYAQAEDECLHAMASLTTLSTPVVALAGMLHHFNNPSSSTINTTTTAATDHHTLLARRLYRRLAVLYPHDPVALVARGMALARDDKRAGEALDHFDEALRVTKGTFAPALRGKGLLLVARGGNALNLGAEGQEVEEPQQQPATAALRLFLQGLDVMPTNVPLLRTTAIHLLLHMPLATTATTNNNHRGSSLGGEMKQQAITFLTRALSLEPNDVPTLIACALARLQYHGDMQGAHSLLLKGAQVSITAGDKARCLRVIGHMHYDRGMNDRAAEAFRGALQVCPRDPVANVAYAACLLASSATSSNGGGSGATTSSYYEKPEKYFQRAWREGGSSGGEPSSTYCHLLYGIFKLKVRYDRAAARDLLLVAARDKTRPPNCLALYYLGRIAMAENKLVDMEKWMVWAIETEPQTFLQVVEWVFMLEELRKDFLSEKVVYEQARRRRKERTKTIRYKEKWMERFELFKRIHHYGKLRDKYLREKQGLEAMVLMKGGGHEDANQAAATAGCNAFSTTTTAPFPYTNTIMAEVGWERRYARTYYDEPDSWASLFCAQLATEEAVQDARPLWSHRRGSTTTTAATGVSYPLRPKSAMAGRVLRGGHGMMVIMKQQQRGEGVTMVGELKRAVTMARPATAPATRRKGGSNGRRRMEQC